MRLVLACLAVIALVVGIIRGSDADDGPSEGVRLEYRMDLAGVDDPAATIANAVDVVRMRLDERAWSPRVNAVAPDRIVVELPVLEDEELAMLRDLLARSAVLEVKIVESGSEYMRTLAERVHYDANAGARGITAEVDTGQGGPYQDWYLKAADREESLDAADADQMDCGPADPDGKRRCRVWGHEVIERYVNLDPAFVVPGDRQLAYQRIEPAGARPYWRTHYLQRTAVLDGSAIKRAATTHDRTGVPGVLIELTPKAAKVFAEVTAPAIAIVLDGRVKSVAILDGPVQDGRIAIGMGGTDADAQLDAMDLVAVLKNGALPGPLILESSTPFSRPGSFINRSWMFFAAAALLALAAVVISLRSRKSSS